MAAIIQRPYWAMEVLRRPGNLVEPGFPEVNVKCEKGGVKDSFFFKAS